MHACQLCDQFNSFHQFHLINDQFQELTSQIEQHPFNPYLFATEYLSFFISALTSYQSSKPLCLYSFLEQSTAELQQINPLNQLITTISKRINNQFFQQVSTQNFSKDFLLQTTLSQQNLTEITDQTIKQAISGAQFLLQGQSTETAKIQQNMRKMLNGVNSIIIIGNNPLVLEAASLCKLVFVLNLNPEIANSAEIFLTEKGVKTVKIEAENLIQIGKSVFGLLTAPKFIMRSGNCVSDAGTGQICQIMKFLNKKVLFVIEKVQISEVEGKEVVYGAEFVERDFVDYYVGEGGLVGPRQVGMVQ